MDVYLLYVTLDSPGEILQGVYQHFDGALASAKSLEEKLNTEDRKLLTNWRIARTPVVP